MKRAGQNNDITEQLRERILASEGIELFGVYLELVRSRQMSLKDVIRECECEPSEW